MIHDLSCYRLLITKTAIKMMIAAPTDAASMRDESSAVPEGLVGPVVALDSVVGLDSLEVSVGSVGSVVVGSVSVAFSEVPK